MIVILVRIKYSKKKHNTSWLLIIKRSIKVKMIKKNKKKMGILMKNRKKNPTQITIVKRIILFPNNKICRITRVNCKINKVTAQQKLFNHSRGRTIQLDYRRHLILKKKKNNRELSNQMILNNSSSKL